MIYIGNKDADREWPAFHKAIEFALEKQTVEQICKGVVNAQLRKVFVVAWRMRKGIKLLLKQKWFTSHGAYCRYKNDSDDNADGQQCKGRKKCFLKWIEVYYREQVTCRGEENQADINCDDQKNCYPSVTAIEQKDREYHGQLKAHSTGDIA